MGKENQHHYAVTVTWTGNKGEGTANYRAFTRDHSIQVEGKPVIPGSSDPSFRGSPDRYNPEDLLLSSLSACHMLWYLHLCSVNDIVVVDYKDQAKGAMLEKADGSGHFTEVTLCPVVTIADPTRSASRIEKAQQLHHEASKMCFVANSVNFPVRHEPQCRFA